jgi:hypothetical protein
MSDREILDAMQMDMDNEISTKRSLGFIKRRRKEFSIAKRVLLGKLDEKYKNHMVLLSNTTDELVKILMPMWPFVGDETLEFVVGESEDWEETARILISPETKWLFSHVKKEIPKLRTTDNWIHLKISDFSEEMIDKLREYSERKEFPGKCEVCRDWETPEI